MEDERILAEAAARKANREWIASKRGLDFRYEDALTARLTSSPINYPLLVMNRSNKFYPSSLHSADAFFSGDGGDEVFFRNNQRYCISDRIYRNGLFRGLIGEARNAAIRDARTVWSVLGGAFYDAVIPHRMRFSTEAFQYKRLMSNEVLEDLKRSDACESFWFRSNRDAPPGKLWHIMAMLPRLGGEVGFGGDAGSEGLWNPDVIDPLRSQPVIELALTIPTHFFWLGRKERGLALKCFEADLTRETLERKWKGGISRYHTDMTTSNASAIASIVENSPLITEHILDRSMVQKSLSELIDGKSAHAAELLGAADFAVFLEVWNNSGCLRRSSSFNGARYLPKLVAMESQ